MTTLITLVIPPGGDAGPFDLYSNVDGYVTPFATGISAAILQAGYTSSAVPNGATIIRVRSTGTCTNYIDININLIPTTTTTSSSSTSTTSSTTTAVPFTSTTTSSTTVVIPPTTSSTTTAIPPTSTTTSTSSSTSTSTSTSSTTTSTTTSTPTSTTTTTNTTSAPTYVGQITNNTGSTITANTALIRVNGNPVAFVSLNIAPGATQTFSTTYTVPVSGVGNNFTLELYTYTGVSISNTMQELGGDCTTTTSAFTNAGSYLTSTSTTTGPSICSIYFISMAIA